MVQCVSWTLRALILTLMALGTSADDDGGGVANSDAFPLDATETLDTDSDGIGNNADTDDDGDDVQTQLTLSH